jgi:hypothetical protein
MKYLKYAEERTILDSEKQDNQKAPNNHSVRKATDSYREKRLTNMRTNKDKCPKCSLIYK